VAQVRACSTGNTAASGPDLADGGGELTARTATSPDHDIDANGNRPTADKNRVGADEIIRPTSPFAGGPAALAGPDCLGRSLIIGPGRPIPEPWTGCREIKVSVDGDPVPPEIIDVLQQAWCRRERIIVKLDGAPVPEPADQAVAFTDLSAETDIENDRLHFLLTANAVDLTGPSPRFQPRQLALDKGALETPDDGSEAEVTLPDGSRAWVDGGPLDVSLAGRPDLDGAALVPRCHLIAGSIRPLRPPSDADDRHPSYADLAPDQQAAVEHRGGPARILAPAGSGKTRVLTERVRFLVDRCGVDPKVLGLVAYNRRARAEMTDRLAGTGHYHLDSIRTLNSLALAVATGRNGFVGGSPATTIDEREMRRILATMMPRQRRRQLNDPLEPWVDALSMARLGLSDPDEVADRFGGDLDGFADVMDRYRRYLAANNLLDFDEQILRAVEILASNRAAREQARRLMPLILVDEFQDLTPAHLLLIRLIAGPANEIFAVGDDDQTIYSYSGASPRWLIDFERFFPGATSHFLTVNYRCPAPVVVAAENLLSHNRHRVVKTITAADTGTSQANTLVEPLVVHGTGDPQENLVEHVTHLLGAGVRPDDIAVLARVNAALLPAMLYLTDAGVATGRPPGVDVSMLDRSGAGAALAWVRLATAPEKGLQPDDLRLALRRPPRSVHPRIVDWICEQRSVWHLRKLADRLNTERDSTSVRGLADDIADLQTMVAGHDGADTETILHHVLHHIGLLGAAGQLDGSQRTARRAAHCDELLALLAVARLHPNPETFETWLRERLSRPATSPAGAGHQVDHGSVSLATVHATKGLEWPHVVVHDVRDGLYPHRLAEDREEERRIFHVAITRGRNSVALTGSGPRSPFIDELNTRRTEPWPTTSEAIEAASAKQLSLTRRTGAASGEAPTTTPKRTEPASAVEARLRESLTDWRRQRAKADGVPAYVVLNNKSLDAIAASEPQNLLELGTVPGIGPSRLDQYGDEILGVVAEVTD